eukprot:TRINITY_DN15108_c0_g2_i1.p1 TRINITY_DN15108_c0_g2~~TRINITY_DN15108_c0_g2_i1.p1  ORF type:complete len:468 (+),score=114.82 TRINITY_DN15108_c0_g2_i1:57-1406(+)
MALGTSSSSTADADEPAAKRARGILVPEGAGEVRFNSAHEALKAKETLDGSILMGAKIKVVMDINSQDGTKILIYDMAPGLQWQELKDHFSQCGVVAYASTGNEGRGKGFIAPNTSAAAGGPLHAVGEVRMSHKDEADLAIKTLHGTEFGGKIINVEADKSSVDSTKLLINNIPDETHWIELKELFATCGKVMFAGIQGGCGGKGKGIKGSILGKGSPTGTPALPGSTLPLQNVEGIDPGKPAGEVRYEHAGHAALALSTLDKQLFKGSIVRVVQDFTCRDNSRILIGNLPDGTTWQELKQHFQKIGQIAFCGIKLPPGYVPPLHDPIAEIRYENPQHAVQAVALLNGSRFNGAEISITQDTGRDGSRLFIRGVPSGSRWQDLKEHFAPLGPIAYAGIKDPLAEKQAAALGKGPPSIPIPAVAADLGAGALGNAPLLSGCGFKGGFNSW